MFRFVSVVRRPACVAAIVGDDCLACPLCSCGRACRFGPSFMGLEADEVFAGRGAVVVSPGRTTVGDDMAASNQCLTDGGSRVRVKS